MIRQVCEVFVQTAKFNKDGIVILEPVYMKNKILRSTPDVIPRLRAFGGQGT
jgi:hypothetical protein